MIFIGIDPGTATTGFAVLDVNVKTKKSSILDFGVIKTKKNFSDSQRLCILGEDFLHLLKTYKPVCVSVEKLFFTTNQKTAMSVSQSRGVVLYLAETGHIPVLEFTPLQVKNFICGYGKADKKQVQFMVKKIFSLKKTPTPDDAADAIAIALCGSHFFKTQNTRR